LAARRPPDDGRWADRGVAPRTGNRIGWVVVADEAIARILVSDDETPGALRPERALTDPKAHAKEGELDHERGRRSGVVSSEGGQPAGRNAGGGASLVNSAGEEDVHLEAKSFAGASPMSSPRRAGSSASRSSRSSPRRASSACCARSSTPRSASGSCASSTRT
jgi:hypothetical protein